MKCQKRVLWWVIGIALAVPMFRSAHAEDADALIERAENNSRGTTYQGQLTMTVDHGDTHRTMTIRVWTEGKDKAVVKILSPAKDRGVSNLRLKLDLWQYLPNVESVVKIPPSMMLQSWMGSDFTNDDLVKTSSLSRDYTHQIVGKATAGGLPIAKVLCLPKPNAPVVWGKIIEWVRLKDAATFRREFYSEEGKLIKSLDGKDFRAFGSHVIPTTVTMTPMGNAEKGRTTLKCEQVKFDAPISSRIFTQEFLRSPVRD